VNGFFDYSVSDNGESLIISAVMGYTSTIELLLKISKRIPQRECSTALALAISNSRAEACDLLAPRAHPFWVVEELLNLQADLFDVMECQSTPLTYWLSVMLTRMKEGSDPLSLLGQALLNGEDATALLAECTEDERNGALRLAVGAGVGTQAFRPQKMWVEERSVRILAIRAPNLLEQMREFLTPEMLGRACAKCLQRGSFSGAEALIALGASEHETKKFFASQWDLSWDTKLQHHFDQCVARVQHKHLTEQVGGRSSTRSVKKM